MIEIGRLCLKIAGRDAGCKCVIVDILDNSFVLIDGETRRRKCNILHIEPLKQVIKIKKGASHEDIKTEFKKLDLKARDTKPKQKKSERPKKVKVKKEKKAEEKKDSKKKDSKKADKKSKPEKKEVKPKKTSKVAEKGLKKP